MPVCRWACVYSGIPVTALLSFAVRYASTTFFAH